MTACSAPPVYWSTGSQDRARSGSTGACWYWGLRYRREYQLESMKVSIVSVSRGAGWPHRGHVVLTNSACRARGDSPVGWNSAS